ncbi:MAG: hypothetical protein HYS06_10035 [Methylocystis sp.]|nr:hypothetical protein [Methylocystis sp.]MBI3274429.1 hypothetical protein [Methylocystis sp.]
MTQNKIVAKDAEKFLSQRDPRAEQGRRLVSVGREKVLIARRINGMSMLVSVPVAAYLGVALDVQPTGGGARYRLSLAHRDPDLDVVLTETLDDAAVSADWRYWASYLDLPRLAGKHGAFATLDPRIGAVVARGVLARRRNGALSKRRPRFLTRRKSGDPTRMAAVFEGEREIVCYE